MERFIAMALVGRIYRFKRSHIHLCNRVAATGQATENQ